MYKPRHIEKHIQEMSRYFKVILINGARQVGKTTLLKNLYPQLAQFTFDPSEDIYNIKTEPSFFLKRYAPPIILDEIQYAPELLPAIKRFVDENPERPQYFMTGSQNLALLKSVSESMAGRVGIVDLWPMTIYERYNQVDNAYWLHCYLTDPQSLHKHIQGTLTNADVLHTLWSGGMPGYSETPDTLLYKQFSSYIKTYVERDIRTLGEITAINDFTSFMGIMAALTAQEINYAQLGREIDITGPTAKKWLSILEQTFQWRSIPAYSTNIIKRVSLKKKGYFTDTGLACYLQHISNPEALLSHPLRGALFETMVVNTITSLLSCMPFEPQLYHWRSNGGAEVDLIIAFDNKLYPIEIKMKTVLNGNDLRGLKAFKSTYQTTTTTVMPGIVIYLGEHCLLLDDDIFAVPWNGLARKK